MAHIGYFIRFSTMIFGRFINRWWRNKSKDDKLNFMNKIKEKRKLISVVGIGGVGLYTSVYIRSREKSPISNRTRSMLLSRDTVNEISVEELKSLLESESLVHWSNPCYPLIKSIIQSIVNKNKHKYPDINKNWRLYILDNEEIINAACLPTGDILVFTGMLNFVENHHQLAGVLAHEMSHVLLEHSREVVSYHFILWCFKWVLGLIIYIISYSDFTGILISGMKNKATDIIFELPYNRLMESEADVLGSELAARACFSNTEGSRFWEMLDIYENSKIQLPPWLSTHPRSKDRAELLRYLEPELHKIRIECGCENIMKTTPKLWKKYFVFL